MVLVPILVVFVSFLSCCLVPQLSLVFTPNKCGKAEERTEHLPRKLKTVLILKYEIFLDNLFLLYFFFLRLSQKEKV